MKKTLVICGPTATGKTAFGLKLAEKFKGEIISADSRQVFKGMDVITGKDIPGDTKLLTSPIKWRGKNLGYYLIDGIKIWLYDIVYPNEPFNVSFWKECAELVINHLEKEKKIPIIIGGTGLYLKSLTVSLSQISVPPDLKLRAHLSDKNVDYLFNYLNRLDPAKGASLNRSDRNNPRRLIRAVEISSSKSDPARDITNLPKMDIFQIGLIAPLDYLKKRIDKRIESRLNQGAATEAKIMLRQYDSKLPSLSACGYNAFRFDNYIQRWKTLEYRYVRRQLTWFKKQPDIHWFDISVADWQVTALDIINNWYNKYQYAKKD